MSEKCICGHVAQGHRTIDLGCFPYWDIGGCDYYKCKCERFRMHTQLNEKPKEQQVKHKPLCVICGKEGIHAHIE